MRTIFLESWFSACLLYIIYDWSALPKAAVCNFRELLPSFLLFLLCSSIPEKNYRLLVWRKASFSHTIFQPIVFYSLLQFTSLIYFSCGLLNSHLHDIIFLWYGSVLGVLSHSSVECVFALPYKQKAQLMQERNALLDQPMWVQAALI